MESTHQPVNGRHVAIIGGGPAGCEAAHILAQAGVTVDLIEKENTVGGNLNNWFCLFPDRKRATEVTERLKEGVCHPNITLRTDTEAVEMQADGNGGYAVTLSDKCVLKANALLVTSGFRTFDARRKEEYGYGIYSRVITSVELENSFANHSLTLADGTTPRRVGFIHCVGSRDEKVCNYHCSKVCCVTAVKQAIEVRELLPEAEIFCFYMDMRMFGPGYEEMYRDAQEKYHIKFVRGRLSEASEKMNQGLQIKVEDTLVGRPLKMTLDLMVLMVGMEASEGSRNAASQLGLALSPNGFIRPKDPHYATNRTDKAGVFVAGCCTSPMNLTDTLTDARSAACAILDYLHPLTPNS